MECGVLSEPLVNRSKAGGVSDAGDVEEQDTTEVTPESSVGDALRDQVPQGHHRHRTQH